MNTPDRELQHCLTCNQMTNHKGEKCLKHRPDNWNEDMERNEELMNMNTPDTESEPYSGEFDTTKKNWTVKELRKMAKEIFTPDTEGETVDRYSVETGLLKRFFKLYEEGRKTGDPQNFIDYFKAEHYLLIEVGKAISSRDTYWKERVRKMFAELMELEKNRPEGAMIDFKAIAKAHGITNEDNLK